MKITELKKEIEKAVNDTLEQITEYSNKNKFVTYTIQKTHAREIVRENFKELIK